MAIHRGIQSALFYYLSCAPCTDARARRARRKEAGLLRLEKQAQAEAYRSPDAIKYPEHPAPSQTNHGWDIEIALGPSRESKALAKQRKKEAQEACPRTSASSGPSEKGKRPSLMDSPQELAAWTQAFQRPDGPYTMHARKAALASKGKVDLAPLPESCAYAALYPFDGLQDVAKPKPARLAKTPTTSTARPARPNPPINDLHPPTITRYDSKRDVSWILDPPPPAKYMGGLMRERSLAPLPEGSNNSDDIPAYVTVDVFSPQHCREQNLSLDDSATTEDVQNLYEAFERPRMHARKSILPPASSRDGSDPFVFPVKQPWVRRDSATTGEEDWDDFSFDRVRDQGPPTKRRPTGHTTDPRWRWSIDW